MCEEPLRKMFKIIVFALILRYSNATIKINSQIWYHVAVSEVDLNASTKVEIQDVSSQYNCGILSMR